MDLLSRINFALDRPPLALLVLCCTVGLLLLAAVIVVVDQDAASGLIFSRLPPRG